MSTTVDNALQVVALAIDLEQHCGLLYQEWARRFKPYDRGISELLQELAEEERAHAQEFLVLQEAIAAGEVLETIPLPPEFDACLERLEAIQDHYFVTGPVMATTILEAALEIEHFTHRLYKDLGSSANTSVAEVCHRLGEYEEGHAQILLERLEFEKQKLPLE